MENKYLLILFYSAGGSVRNIAHAIADGAEECSLNVKIRTDKAAMAGRINGRTTYQKILNSDTPSTLAASINSNGRARIKLRMKKVQKPV